MAARIPCARLARSGLLGLALAGCGGVPVVASQVTAAPPPASAAPTPLPSAAQATPPAPAPRVEMKPPVATAMEADLRGLGLDPGSLPPLGKLEPRALRGVMKLFARALGVRCADCHMEGDVAAQTRRKKIAARMWDEFVGKLARTGGDPLFCDSCHQGRTRLLDRSDKKALRQWMDGAFVEGLRRRDGKANECETCHVGGQMNLLSTWAGGAAQ